MRQRGATNWSPVLMVGTARAPGWASGVGFLELTGNRAPATAFQLWSCGHSLVPGSKLE